MDQSKCINDVISKYQDFPTIQTDIKRVIKYTESQFRLFCKKFLNDTDRTEEETVKGITHAVNVVFKETLSDINAHGLSVKILLDTGDAPSPINAIAKIVVSYPESIHADLQATASAIHDNILENLHDTLKDLTDAQENGFSLEEHVVMLVNHHLPPLLAKHPDADQDQLRQDLTVIAAVYQSILLTDMRGKVDRLIAAAKQGAANALD